MAADSSSSPSEASLNNSQGPSTEIQEPVPVFLSLDDAAIDPGLIKAYRGTVSLRFKPGKHSRVAVKIVGDRGIDSLKVAEVV